MKAWKAAVIALLIAAGATTGCAVGPGTDNFKDLEDIKFRDPTQVTGYNNVDKHPNLAVVCLEGGVAFVTSNRDYKPFERVPELDKTCPGGAR